MTCFSCKGDVEKSTTTYMKNIMAVTSLSKTFHAPNVPSVVKNI